MKGWLRLAVALSVLWMLLCVGNAVYICKVRFDPTSPFVRVGRTVSEVREAQVYHPSIGKVAFPSGMSREEIEKAMWKESAKIAGASTDAGATDFTNFRVQLRWDRLDERFHPVYVVHWSQLLLIALIPAGLIFIGVLLFGWTLRWIADGFGEFSSFIPFVQTHAGLLAVSASILLAVLVWAVVNRYEWVVAGDPLGASVKRHDRWTGEGFTPYD